jgi:acyl-coenzyme A synthetase/AMP-(fatty) acid ligase
MSRLAWLLKRFSDAPDKEFTYWRDTPYTYGWLHERVGAYEAELDDAGVTRGMVVAVRGDFSPETVAMLFALVNLNTILVPLTSSVAANEEEFLAIAEVRCHIVFEDASGYAIHWKDVEPTHALSYGLIKDGEPGLVLFSSGSTGKSKAALHRFLPLIERHKKPRQAMVTITFLLFDHIGGINTLLYILANAGTMIALDQRDPDTVCRAIERYKVELLPTSPTFLNLLILSEAYRRYDLSSLKRVTYGTEMMPEHTLRRIHEILPEATLQQTYGLSELGILRSKSQSNDSLWVKVGGGEFETKVVDDVLWVRSQSAMLGYLNAPSPFDADGWYNTGDKVEVDGEYLKILGRESEVINVGGEKVYPAEVENVLMQMDNVSDATVVGEPHHITGRIVTARVNLDTVSSAAEFRREMRRFCKGRLAPFKVPTKVSLVENAQYGGRFKKMRNQ